MSRTPRTDKKVAHAEYHLDRIRDEHEKISGQDPVAIEANIAACLGAIGSGLYRLKKEVGGRAYAAALLRWRRTLSPAEWHRFKRMKKLRDLDVHEEDVEGPMTSARQAAEDAVAGARQMAADPGAADDAVAEALRRAQVLVDVAASDALNLLGVMLGRWREQQTRLLLDAARTRWGMQQQIVRSLPTLVGRPLRFSIEPGAVVPEPDPPGWPWIHKQKVHLEAADAATTCSRYLDLLKGLVRQFQ